MQTRSRLLDDMARLANGTAGVASGLREEIEALLQQRLERILSDMELVRRSDFEIVEKVAIRAREEQELLERRVAALEKALAARKRKQSSAKTAAGRTGKTSDKS
ncbi:MAG: pyrroline-5-carboxylate reductase [Alphaproteobacteria bacterium]|nr:pyrroline-5-carboxylate reductase [Alphaproteobacteria bacterium]HCP01077.1 pyrroline-5-carboxylate reductase [Rhodospirillaceae bacterium]